MGEFWFNSPTHDKPNDMLDAISGAHVYGKNIIQAEGFTQVRGTWNEHPALLKPLLDRNYALGINRLFFSRICAQSVARSSSRNDFGWYRIFLPARSDLVGKGGESLVDYTRRCQALLQYGHPVVDIAVFTGEEIPRRAVLPERLVPSLPGLFGSRRVESEKNRLANIGQPLRTIVGVTHSANMADPENWVNPLRGYAYDSFNKDALLCLASVDKGRICLPGGASYKVLVLPLPRPMDPDGLPLSTEVQAKSRRVAEGRYNNSRIALPLRGFCRLWAGTRCHRTRRYSLDASQRPRSPRFISCLTNGGRTSFYSIFERNKRSAT